METFEQMEMRHAAERAAMVRRLQVEAHASGATGDDTFSAIAKESKLTQIARATAAKHGVTEADLLGDRRFVRIVAARFEAMSVARGEGFSLTEIGNHFGRDHTSVINAIRRHREAQNAD